MAKSRQLAQPVGSWEIQWACPACRGTLGSLGENQFESCYSCGQRFVTDKSWLDLCASEDRINLATEAAYKVYSKYYAPVALLAYLLVWRGNFIRHVRFFQDLMKNHPFIVDLATGDGSLTSLALNHFKRVKVQRMIAVDISGEMLAKAGKKLPKNNVCLLRGDVCQLPFQGHSINAISCFGGLNSFPSGEKALCEMSRCLSFQGVLRGSVLLLPKQGWRKNLVFRWIQKGYQTEVVDDIKFKSWIEAAGLEITESERNGDVFLFELRHKKSVS